MPSASHPSWGGLDWESSDEQHVSDRKFAARMRERDQAFSEDDTAETSSKIPLREELDFRVLEVLGGVGLGFGALFILLGVAVTVMQHYGHSDEVFNFRRFQVLSRVRSGEISPLQEFGKVGELSAGGELVGVTVEDDDYPEVAVSGGEIELHGGLGMGGLKSGGWRSIREDEEGQSQNEKEKSRKKKEKKRDKEVRRLREENKHLRDSGEAFA